MVRKKISPWSETVWKLQLHSFGKIQNFLVIKLVADNETHRLKELIENKSEGCYVMSH
jgi:hypothetical protein